MAHGFVYFAFAPKVNRVKIGFSYYVRSRLETFRTGSPEELILLAAIKGSESKERELHRRFTDDNVRLEWFEFSSDIVRYLAQLSTNAVSPAINRR